MELETLKLFCEEGHPKVGQPWTDGQYTYASDGFIIIRLPGRIVENEGKIDAKILPWNTVREGVKPDLHITAEEVKAAKERHGCRHENYHRIIDAARDCMAECPRCDDTGWINWSDWALPGGIRVSPWFLDRIVTHCGDIDVFLMPPEVVGYTLMPVGFRFAGGDGLIMPKTAGERIVNEGVKVEPKSAVRRCRVCGCRVCGCTDDDCRQCIAKTGTPCHWIEEDLCSACV